MPISSLSGGTTPEPIQTQPVSKPVSKAEARMTSVSVAINAEVPEGVLLGSKKIEPLSSSLLPRTSPEAVNSEARKILAKNQVSGEVTGGLDAVASARLSPRFNRLLRSTAQPSAAPEGIAQPLPEPDVYASGHISIIFTPGKATIVGLEGEDLVQFRQNLERTNPDVATRLAAIPKEEVFFVSRKEEQEINQLVDSKLALMATELREGLTERVPETEESLAAEEEKQESGEEVGEEVAKGPVSVAERVQRRIIPETPASVIAAAVNEVFAQHLLSITQESAAWLRAAAGMMLSNARQREREAAESSKKRQEENREIEREDIKKDQKDYDLKQEAIESDQTRSSTQQAATRRGKAISSESIALGVYQEKKQAGEPSPPPNPRTSSS